MNTNVKIDNAENKIKNDFYNFILTQNHPCVMAQSAFKRNNIKIEVYNAIDSKDVFVTMFKDIEIYLNSYDFTSTNFYTFLAVFPNDVFNSEKAFESKLWNLLQQLHNIDKHPWDAQVSADPENNNFSFSLAGKAFFVVGLHANSSRIARQSPYTAIAFNLHEQFERLRNLGTFDDLKNMIRERDKKLQGTINPMVKDFSEASEAIQYSGRNTDKDWKCPFHAKHNSKE